MKWKKHSPGWGEIKKYVKADRKKQNRTSDSSMIY